MNSIWVSTVFHLWLTALCDYYRSGLPLRDGGNRQSCHAPFDQGTPELVMHEIMRKAVPNAIGSGQRKPGKQTHCHHGEPAADKTNFSCDERDDPRRHQ